MNKQEAGRQIHKDNKPGEKAKRQVKSIVHMYNKNEFICYVAFVPTVLCFWSERFSPPYLQQKQKCQVAGVSLRHAFAANRIETWCALHNCVGVRIEQCGNADRRRVAVESHSVYLASRNTVQSKSIMNIGNLAWKKKGLTFSSTSWSGRIYPFGIPM